MFIKYDYPGRCLPIAGRWRRPARQSTVDRYRRNLPEGGHASLFLGSRMHMHRIDDTVEAYLQFRLLLSRFRCVASNWHNMRLLCCCSCRCRVFNQPTDRGVRQVKKGEAFQRGFGSRSVRPIIQSCPGSHFDEEAWFFPISRLSSCLYSRLRGSVEYRVVIVAIIASKHKV